MSPPFIFRIDEIQESSTAPVIQNTKGQWEPSNSAGAHVQCGAGVGVSGMYWFCTGNHIERLPLQNGQLPPAALSYGTFSMYYCEGYGFYVTRDNATQQAERWLPLTFDHDDLNYSSYVTNAGSARTLRCQRPDQQWPQMLLPDIYQAPPVTAHQAYGGLKGDLAILLALVAFSMSREHLPQYLQSMFLGETWQVHGLPHGRTHKRGVVVWVYTCPTRTQSSTSDDLRDYEEGVYGLYYH